MKTTRLICPGPQRIELEEVELGPTPDDAILVRNEYTAVSAGTEIYNYIHGGEPGQAPQFPRTTGYCCAGTVLEVGKLVSGVKAGDRVAGEGPHAGHAILRSRYQPVPDTVSTKSAAYMVMAAIAIRGIRVARIELGHSVAVTGLGVVGQLAATLAGLAGAVPIIGIDPDASRLERAKARGMDVCINAGGQDLVAAVRDACPEDGANVVIEATGKPAVMPTALRLACTAGRVVVLGSPRGTVDMDLMADVHLREVSILGAFQPLTPERPHTHYPWTKDRERALIVRLMSNGRLPIDDLITEVARPPQCQQIYDMLVAPPSGVLGVVFQW